MSRGTILLIEEDEPARSVRVRALEAAGYEVTLAESGDQAIRMICREAPTAVVMHCSLPGVSGIRATQVLKDDPELQDLPVLLVGDRDQEEQAREVGCDAYLSVSSRPARLLDELHRLTRATVEIPRARPYRDRDGHDDPQPMRA